MLDTRNTILISFFGHILLALLLYYLPQLFPQELPKESTPIEVSILQNEDKGKQILSADPLLDRLEKVEKETKYLADKTRRVKKETQAPVSNQSAKMNLQGPTIDFKEAAKEGEAAEKQQKQLDLRSAMASQNRSLLENVDIGQINALNTDQDMYYSFYSRVNDLLWIRWTSRVRETENVLNPKVLQRSGQDRWTTIVDVSLKPSGHLAHVMIVKPSGYPAFDRDAANAFQEASYFPNPPPELVQEDGFVHLHYALTVITPKVLIP